MDSKLINQFDPLAFKRSIIEHSDDYDRSVRNEKRRSPAQQQNPNISTRRVSDSQSLTEAEWNAQQAIDWDAWADN